VLQGSGQAIFCSGLDIRFNYDGFRVLITKHGDTVRLDSRNGLNKAYCFPELVAEIRPIPHDSVADGELVILRPDTVFSR
jgi:ATP-dependent DNA ligase